MAAQMTNAVTNDIVNDNSSLKERATLAALDLAAEYGWLNVSLQDVSAKADIDIDTLRQYFEDRIDLLVTFGHMINRKSMASLPSDIDGLSQHDILFDLLMDRFDHLNTYRGGVIAVLDSFKFDPKQALLCVPHLGRSMAWMLETAGIDTNGIKGMMRVVGLCAIYMRTAYVWSHDDSPDMGKTMAALDKNLGTGEKLVNLLGL